MRIFKLGIIFFLFGLFFLSSAIADTEDLEESKKQAEEMILSQYNSRLELGCAYIRNGDFENALDQYRQANELLKKPVTHFFIGIALLKMEKFKEAETSLNDSIAAYLQQKCVDAYYPVVFLARAEIKEGKGDYDGAIRDLTYVLIISPYVEDKKTAILGINRMDKERKKRVKT
jgi:tetratricopeptide (TPR) repeat protein